VHHHDGTLGALDARGTDQDVDGLYRVVEWVAAKRNFLGPRAWDEYGRRLDGLRTTDLIGHATRVVDGQVQIGDIVAAPAGSPIAENPTTQAVDNRTIQPDPIVATDAATALPVGTTAWIDATIYCTPDGSHVCATPENPVATPRCPEGSPTVGAIAATPGTVLYYLGPLLATSSAEGFERVASTGGRGGATLG
jgi:hypothetical protein